MPMYDRKCSTCGLEAIDCLEPVRLADVLCAACGGTAPRVWLRGRTSAVIGDDIPGGVEIRHGLCNEDGSPRRYYSKSEMAREAKARGLENTVRHAPLRGTDKSPHTSRWV